MYSRISAAYSQHLSSPRFAATTTTTTTPELLVLLAGPDFARAVVRPPEVFSCLRSLDEVLVTQRRYGRFPFPNFFLFVFLFVFSSPSLFSTAGRILNLMVTTVIAGQVKYIESVT